MAKEPPDEDRITSWRDEAERRGPARLRGGRRRPARGARLPGRRRTGGGARMIRRRVGKLLGRGDGEPKAAPFIVGVGRSGTTLLRMMLDAHPELTIPPETHFLPELIDMTKRKEATRRRGRRLPARAPRAGATSASTGGAARAPVARRDPLTARRALRSFYDLYARSRASRAGARSRPATRRTWARSPPPARGALHPPDPRRPRRRALEAAKARRRRAGPRRPRSAGRRIDPRAQALAEGRPLHRGPLRGPGHRHRADAARGLRVLRAPVGRRDPALPRALRRPPRGDEARAARTRTASPPGLEQVLAERRAKSHSSSPSRPAPTGSSCGAKMTPECREAFEAMPASC